MTFEMRAHLAAWIMVHDPLLVLVWLAVFVLAVCGASFGLGGLHASGRWRRYVEREDRQRERRANRARAGR